MNHLDIQLSGQVGTFTLNAHLHMDNLHILGITGHSAAGKTMLLRGIAGLERSFKGLIKINDSIWLDTLHNINLPPHQRKVGFVFQEPRLLPHLTIEKNLQFAEKNIQKNSLTIKKEMLLECLALGGLLQRYPHQLSGGQQQRVAIARTALFDPTLFLMDEPLAHLNHDLKQPIMTMIDELAREFKRPILYVSHDDAEIRRLATHVTSVIHGCVQPIQPYPSALER